MKNYENGITLIALVVTIIVILILAGVSFSYSIGQNEGIILRAYEGGRVYSNSLHNEVQALTEFDEEVGGVINTEVYN